MVFLHHDDDVIVLGRRGVDDRRKRTGEAQSGQEEEEGQLTDLFFIAVPPFLDFPLQGYPLFAKRIDILIIAPDAGQSRHSDKNCLDATFGLDRME
jgi:hypothetical protein